jgi:hypothetical protein
MGENPHPRPLSKNRPKNVIIDFHNYHEPPGRWEQQGQTIKGSIRTAWSRYNFAVNVDNFVYSAIVSVYSGTAAGLLLIRQGENRSGGVALLDMGHDSRNFCAQTAANHIDNARLWLKRYHHPE